MRSENVIVAKRWARRALRTALILSPIVAVTLWLAAHHRPSWYRPLQLDDEGFQRARRESVAAADDFGDKLVLGKPFDVTLRQEEINEWLAALPEVWPEAKEALPREVTGVVVRFEPGTLCLAAHVQSSLSQAILSVDLTPEVSSDGTTVRIAAQAVRAGSISIPRVLLERVASWAKPGEPVSNGTERVSIAQLFSGVTTRNRFTWPNGQRPFQIESIVIEREQTRLRIKPL